MGRAPCCDKANVKKGPWSPEEDAKLKEFIGKYGTGGNWIALPQKAGLKRCGKSCRLRWLNYLRPNIKHGEFSDDEDRIICNLYASIGSRWSVIAAQLPGRTDNDIKNYWNTKLKKKLLTIPPLNQKQTFFPSMPFQPPPFYPFTPNSMNVDNISNSLFVLDDHNNVNDYHSSSSTPPLATNLMSNNRIDVNDKCLSYLGFQDDHIYNMCNSPMLMFGSTCSSSEDHINHKQKYQIKKKDNYQITLGDQVHVDQDQVQNTSQFQDQEP